MSTPQGGVAQLVHLAWVDNFGLPGAMFLDCSVSEDHQSTALVTQHAVEQGISITDYIRPLPRRLSIEGIITNTPLTDKTVDLAILTPNASQLAKTYVQYTQPSISASPTGNVALDLKTTLPAPSTIPVVGFQWLSTDTTAKNGGFDRVKHGFDDLVEALSNGYLFTIDTTLASYANMIAVSFMVPRDQNNTDSIQFNIDFMEIRIVGSQTTTAVVRKKTVKVHQKPTSPTTTEQDAGLKDSASGFIDHFAPGLMTPAH